MAKLLLIKVMITVRLMMTGIVIAMMVNGQENRCHGKEEAEISFF